MTISFTQIPDSLRTGGVFVEFDASRAVSGTPARVHRALIVAPTLDTGALASDAPTRVISTGDADRLCGVGSIGAQMIRAFRAQSTVPELWAIAARNPTEGAAPVSTLTVTVEAQYLSTETTDKGELTVSSLPAGTLPLYVGGVRIPVSFGAGKTAAQIASLVAQAIADHPELPVTAEVSEATVTLKGRHRLAICQLDARAAMGDGEKLPTGVSIECEISSEGAGEIDHAALIAALGDKRFHSVVLPDSGAATLKAWGAEMVRRGTALEASGGVAFAAVTGSLGDMLAVGAGPDGDSGPNCERLCLVPAGLSPTPPWIWASALAALDGAENDPLRPRRTLQLVGCVAPQKPLTRDERNQLLWAAVSSVTVDAGGAVRVERLVTTYRSNALGTADTSYLDLTTIRTLDRLRDDIVDRFQLRYPRHKLAKDGTLFGPGQAVITPALARAELIQLFGEWETQGLTQSRAQFEKELFVEINANDPHRLDTNLSPHLLGKFLTGAVLLSFRL